MYSVNNITDLSTLTKPLLWEIREKQFEKTLKNLQDISLGKQKLNNTYTRTQLIAQYFV